MEQQKEPGFVPALTVIGVLPATVLLVTLCHCSTETQKVRDREITASLARQKQVGGINCQEQTAIKKAPPLKLLRD